MRALRGAWLLIALLVGCRQAAPAVSTPAPSPPPRLRIVTTFPPIYCFTKNIVKDLAEVEMLVPEREGIKGYGPTAADLKRISSADVVIENGFGFEPWLDALIPKALKPGAIRVVAARGIQPLPLSSAGPPDALFPPANPYVWLDPLLAITELQTIRDALMARDPANSDTFLANENEYETALRDLDDEVGQATVDLPRRKLLCLTDAFAYFLRRYEFTPIAFSPTASAGSPPAPKEPGEFQAVLVSAGTASQPETISNRFAVPCVQANPMENGPASADEYENVTRANAAAFRQALLPK